MALLPSKSLVFTVRRQEAELVVPCEPTPHECKPLSDIDDQEGHRFHVRGFHFHQSNLSMKGQDPAKVIKEALAKALVFYYPFAGRLREGPNRKLIVDCTGEGVLFIEADADVSLVDFGDELYPPFPCAEELLYDVTRLKCGGFIFAHRFNHTMGDGTGLSQFMTAVGEIAHGALAPLTPPVWERHLLSARDAPLITFIVRSTLTILQVQKTEQLFWQTTWFVVHFYLDNLIFHHSVDLSPITSVVQHLTSYLHTYGAVVQKLWNLIQMMMFALFASLMLVSSSIPLCHWDIMGMHLASLQLHQTLES
uniref:Uncharacterized protein n=1 Tax=Gossypium raimondii TaxID=29730 RepID=A0A0D2SCN8_GOSRA|nr:hypothetical protein B456_013G121500 [Gossypium raimondii]